MENSTVTEVKPRRVALYIRVSTHEQKIDGYSTEAQRKRLMDYVKDNKGLNLHTQEDWIFEDVHTGSDMNREALKDLLKAVDEKKFDAVLVWKIDRMSRSLKHLLKIFERLQKGGASFISLQENLDFRGPIGSLIFQIFGAIAQFERELIKSRTRTGIIASAELGNYTGTNVPYGYRKIPNAKTKKGSLLEIIPAEKKHVQDIYKWYIYENMGDEGIATQLNDLKVPLGQWVKKNKRGEWTDKHVKTILTTEIYRGQFFAVTKDDEGKDLKESQWTVVGVPACVSETVFLLAERTRKERVAGRASAYDYLLSGKLYDVSLPSEPKFAGKPRTKGGRSYRRKQFDKDGIHYPVFEVPTETLEKAVWAKVKLALKDPEIFIKHHLDTERFGADRIEAMGDELMRLREARKNLELRLERIEEAYEEGEYSPEKMSEKSAKVNTKIGRLDKREAEIERELTIASMRDQEIEGLREAAEKVRYNIDHLDRKQQRALINLFVDRIDLNRTEIPSTGKRKRWNITMDVYFRFVPEKFTDTEAEGRTQDGLQDAATGKKSQKSEGIGGVRGT